MTTTTTTSARDKSPAYIGVHACGCVTAACVDMPGDEKGTAKFVADLVKRGVTVERTTVADAKARPHFMPAECPHDPKGWERERERDPDAYKTRKRRTYKRDLYRVELTHRYHRSYPCGEIGKRGGHGRRHPQWWSTPGWMIDDDAAPPTAHNGDEPRAPAAVFGPFATQQEAVDAIAVPALERLITETRARHDKREANPPKREGPVPTHTASGEPVPPFKPGEVWESWAGEYLILDEPQYDTLFARPGAPTPSSGPVVVRAKDLTHPSDPNNLLRPSWTYVTESCFPGMKLKTPAPAPDPPPASVARGEA